MYKADFEEERRDRERVHGLIDDIKKKEMQVEGRAAQERVGYKQELDIVQQDLKYTKEQLHKVRDEAEAARGETSKYFKEAETFRESTKFWRDQAEASQRDVQAKASQVKQYAKELGKLKTKVHVCTCTCMCMHGTYMYMYMYTVEPLYKDTPEMRTSPLIRTRGGWTRSRAYKKWACCPIYNAVQNVSHYVKP